MVFENLTLFELHLENARIGPSFGTDDDEPTSADATGGARHRGRAALALVVVALGVAVAARRRRSSAGGEPGRITIEQTADQ